MWLESGLRGGAIPHANGSGHTSEGSFVIRGVEAPTGSEPLLDAKTMEQQLARVRFLPQAMTAAARC